MRRSCTKRLTLVAQKGAPVRGHKQLLRALPTMNLYRQDIAQGRICMNMIYNSANYCVVEFRSDEGSFAQGYEIMHKTQRKELYLVGDMALHFKQTVEILIAAEPSVEEVDDFLSRFDGLLQQPLVLH
jgi:hypothetical protein